MMVNKETVFAFEDLIEPASAQALSYKWSMGEVGWRHPAGPLGVVFRDQGQTDLYAGPSRLILSLEGPSLLMSKVLAFLGQEINLNVQDVTGLRFMGKHFNPLVFSGSRKLIVPKGQALSKDVGFLTSTAVIDPHTGRVVRGWVPVTDVLEEQPLMIDSRVPMASDLVDGPLNKWIKALEDSK